MYRDPNDVKTIHQLSLGLLLSALVLSISLIFNAFLYLRQPDRIVIDKSTGHVEMINDREYGNTKSVAMTPDRPGASDKIYLVKLFAESLYKIDPQTRGNDIERAIRMMVPDGGAKFANYLKESKVLETQHKESWQSTWEVLDCQVDSANPYLIRLDGRQKTTKVINNATKEETKNIKLQIKLVADPGGRQDVNLRTGFLVNAFDYKELAN